MPVLAGRSARRSRDTPADRLDAGAMLERDHEAMQSWSLGMESWIVQDGNYGDFERGQVAEYAVEFWAPDPLVPISSRGRSARRLDGATYEIAGQVTAIADRAWAVDCGIGIFQDERPPADISVGDWLGGVVNLGIDPFFYFERLHSVDGFPPLIYTWQILSISMQTAPFIEVGGARTRDSGQHGWREVERTDAWHDNESFASYLFDCTLLDANPKRTSATAI